MWKILESREAQKSTKKCPKNIKEEYEAWKKLIELSGPAALRKISGYKDHALKGDWKGARSSYLNKQWRVIYYVEKSEVCVYVIEVNAHDYRKKT